MNERPRITLLLAWYDEDPLWLVNTIASAARIGVDHVVAADGAYYLYEHHSPRSGREQVDAITSICDALNVGLTLMRPRGAWVGGEQQKRAAMFRTASTVAKVGHDWLLCLDADEVVVDGALDVRDELANLDESIVTVYANITQREPYWAQKDRYAAQETAQRHDTVFEHLSAMQSRMWRVVEDMDVLVTHYTYTGRWQGKHYALRNDSVGLKRLGLERAPSETFPWLQIEHLDKFRTRKRQQAKTAYYKRRDGLGVERVNHPRNLALLASSGITPTPVEPDPPSQEDQR